MRWSVRSRCRQASWCTEIQATPASANAGMNSSGFSIIRWQSSGNFVTLRSDFTTGGPIVRFGTKCPSIMSTWMTLAPPSPAARTCSPSRAKSAERIDGASSIKGKLSEPGRSGNDVMKFYHACGAATPDVARAECGAGTPAREGFPNHLSTDSETPRTLRSLPYPRYLDLRPLASYDSSPRRRATRAAYRKAAAPYNLENAPPVSAHYYSLSDRGRGRLHTEELCWRLVPRAFPLS